MAKLEERTVTIQELLVSSLTQTDALAKADDRQGPCHGRGVQTQPDGGCTDRNVWPFDCNRSASENTRDFTFVGGF